MKKIFKKGGVFALSAIMALTMASTGVFAASDDATRQANSSATATVDLEKTLTVNQANKFPNIEDFTFTFERIEAWDNANVSTAQNGANIAKSEIPMPAASETAHHTVTVSGDVATVKTGDYSTSASGDTATARSRSTSLPMTYAKAGYYVYKVDEVNEGVTGVTYDTDSYYVVVYVANNQDANGNTTSGVYVHSITVWQNLQQIQANLNQHNKDIGTDTDNSNPLVSNDNSTGKGDAGKVTTTTSTSPNQQTVNFDNLSTSNDVVISKNVKGSLGDKTKKFEFTVTMTGLVPGTAYTLSNNVDVKETTVGTFTPAVADPASPATITPNTSGNATFTVYLTDDQNIKIEGLPVGATYRVNEAASDHKASYNVTSDSTGTQETRYVAVEVANMDPEKVYYYENDGTDTVVDQDNIVPETETVYEKTTETVGGATIAKASDANTAKETALQCALETVDAGDGTVTVAYTNQRDMATITGVPGLDFMVYGLAALMMAMAAGAIIRRRKAYSAELAE